MYYARNENSTENNADCLDSSKLGEAELCKMDGKGFHRYKTEFFVFKHLNQPNFYD